MRDEARAINALISKFAQNAWDVFFRAALTTFGAGEYWAEMQRKCVNADPSVMRHGPSGMHFFATEFCRIVSYRHWSIEPRTGAQNQSKHFHFLRLGLSTNPETKVTYAYFKR